MWSIERGLFVAAVGNGWRHRFSKFESGEFVDVSGYMNANSRARTACQTAFLAASVSGAHARSFSFAARNSDCCGSLRLKSQDSPLTVRRETRGVFLAARRV